MDPSEIQFNPKKSWFSAHHVLGWIFIIAVTAAVVAGIYYWQTTSNLPSGYQAPKHEDVTANWQTFTNAQYGFSFKYPSDWQADVYKNQATFQGLTGIMNLAINGPHDQPQASAAPVQNCTEACDSPGADAVRTDGANISVSIADSLSTELNRNVNLQNLIENKLQGYDKFSADGFSGYIYIPAPNIGEIIEAYKVLPSGQVIIFNWDRDNEFNDNDFTYQKYLLPILTSLKFTDQTSQTSADTSTWQTYTNSQYAFSLEYPQNWQQKESSGEIIFISPERLAAMQDSNYEGYSGDLIFDTKSYINTATAGTVKTISIGQNDFTQYSGGEFIESANYEINHNSITYHFTSAHDFGDASINQILSTFKFTN